MRKLTDSKDQSPEIDHNTHRESQMGKKCTDKKVFQKKKKEQ